MINESAHRVAVLTESGQLGELIANCEHRAVADRGEFVIGSASRAITWRVVFCDPCWEHFRTHQDVIDLTLFEDALHEAEAAD